MADREKSSDVDSLAGVIADAVRGRLGLSAANSATSSLGSDCMPLTSRPPPTSQSRPRDSTVYERATGLGAGRSSGRGEKRYAPPSIFSSEKKRGKDKKPTVYVRDIVLLPLDFKTKCGKITIPIEVPVGIYWLKEG